MSQTTMPFQAEVKQLLQLMIHSLYSNKEIFMRELISNASDAADKLRFEAVTNSALFENDTDLSIKVEIDAEARTISITDNGIGMSRDDAITHLGTIAKSGTKEFFQKLSGDQKKDASLIGQFGVGFYSAFIVADKVTVESRRAGLESKNSIRWISDGTGEFSIEEIEREQRGTCVTLHLREEENDLLSAWRIKSIIQKYSDHIALPILMKKEEWDEKEGKSVVKDEFETVNQANALWTRSKNDIDENQYKSFYQHLSHDADEPLAWTHNRVEGNNEYIQLIYLPKRAPFDLWNNQQHGGLKLYIQRVFIMDDAEALVPRYLRFIRGVVDSSNLPLNVSRELLQDSRDVRGIRDGVTKRALSMMENLAENEPEKYQTFWQEFGQVLKEGIGEDQSNRDRIAKLLRFASTHNDLEEQKISLSDYVARMQSSQTKIYYVNADSFSAAKNSPHLEFFRKKGIEVLLLNDRVDEWMLSFMHEFDGKPLASVARGDLDINDDAEKTEQKETQESLQPILAAFKETLKDKIKDIRFTNRLTESPACLVVDNNDMSGHLQRLLKAAGQAAPSTLPIMEINADHALVKRLQPKADDFEDWCYLLFEQALLAEGGALDDPASFVKRCNRLLLQTT